MPDALSKTVPIWCAVINLAIQLRRERSSSSTAMEDWDATLYLPPRIVSLSEKSQIESRLKAWAEALEVRTTLTAESNGDFDPHSEVTTPSTRPDQAPPTILHPPFHVCPASNTGFTRLHAIHMPVRFSLDQRRTRRHDTLSHQGGT